MTTRGSAFLIVLALPVMGLAGQRPSLSRKVSVPAGVEGAKISPNGQTNAVRYTAAYEAYWWNCVQVRAAALEERCPFTCSGNPAATQGCVDGATKASNGIDLLVRGFSKDQVEQYLRTLALDPTAQVKLKAYFTDGPRAKSARMTGRLTTS